MERFCCTRDVQKENVRFFLFFLIISASILIIQRNHRSHLARERVRCIQDAYSNRQLTAFFDQSAVSIQRFFRGFYCRKYVHNFFARKTYLKKIAEDSEKVKDELALFEYKWRTADQLRKECEDREKFKKLTSNLHHLISTATRPGVFNPPYANALPTAFNVPLETLIRDSFVPDTVPVTNYISPAQRRRVREAKLKAAGIEIAGKRDPFPPCHAHGTTFQAVPGVSNPQNLKQQLLLSKTASVGRAQNVQGPFLPKSDLDARVHKWERVKPTVAASDKYDHASELVKKENRINELLRVGDRNFRTAVKGETLPLLPSILADVPYYKTESASQNKSSLSQSRQELTLIQKDFKTAVPSGKTFVEYEN